MNLSDSKYLLLTGFIEQSYGCGYVFLSKFYPMCFIHCSALLNTAEKALYKFDITLQFYLQEWWDYKLVILMCCTCKCHTINQVLSLGIIKMRIETYQKERSLYDIDTASYQIKPYNVSSGWVVCKCHAMNILSSTLGGGGGGGGLSGWIPKCLVQREEYKPRSRDSCSFCTLALHLLLLAKEHFGRWHLSNCLNIHMSAWSVYV